MQDRRRLLLLNCATFFALVVCVVFFASCDTWENWIPKFTVTFNTNGGGGTIPTPQSVDARSPMPIMLPNGNYLSKSGFIFGGWNTNAAGTGTNHEGGTTLTPTENITLFARWAVAFTVTFDANGGSGTPPAPQIVAVGFAITLPGSDGLSRTGFTFAGWNTNAGGTGTNHDASTTFTPTGDTTLFARWVVAFSITFADLRNMAPEIQVSQPILLRNGGTADIVVDNPAQYASIRWFHGVRELTSADGVSSDGATLTVGSGIHGNWIGTHHIMLQVEVARGGDLVPYSSVIAFEIRP